MVSTHDIYECFLPVTGSAAPGPHSDSVRSSDIVPRPMTSLCLPEQRPPTSSTPRAGSMRGSVSADRAAVARPVLSVCFGYCQWREVPLCKARMVDLFPLSPSYLKPFLGEGHLRSQAILSPCRVGLEHVVHLSLSKLVFRRLGFLFLAVSGSLLSHHWAFSYSQRSPPEMFVCLFELILASLMA